MSALDHTKVRHDFILGRFMRDKDGKVIASLPSMGGMFTPKAGDTMYVTPDGAASAALYEVVGVTTWRAWEAGAVAPYLFVTEYWLKPGAVE